VRAVKSLDYPLIQGLFLTTTFSVLAANWMVDVAHVWLDPRTRSDRARSSETEALLGLGILGVFALVAVVRPWIVGDPTDFVDVPLLPPSLAHWLGTTAQGQDVLAQTVAGARTLLLRSSWAWRRWPGALVGTAAGYAGGWTDEALSLVINLFLLMRGCRRRDRGLSPRGPATIGLCWSPLAWSARDPRAGAIARQSVFVVRARDRRATAAHRSSRSCQT
jgi:peptide/nickel transport system permease protein